MSLSPTYTPLVSWIGQGILSAALAGAIFKNTSAMGGGLIDGVKGLTGNMAFSNAVNRVFNNAIIKIWGTTIGMFVLNDIRDFYLVA